ncbi:ATP-binding cassette domain-containing protein [Oceanomicrobium pacificus]|uniref:ATP-binding cassette domain-containing protein n=1 Tax=Oceanomicrobium pacificus TaxID=2692916 RepID=A0A6B0TYF9_9RHOB|nr:ATP-binding cassette domain-containing protein [Oceanomicrobium pacificus]MXU66458.1 ATP-binding cassette domain-containing protein [Oceanomicrobium pacificus]
MRDTGQSFTGGDARALAPRARGRTLPLVARHLGYSIDGKVLLNIPDLAIHPGGPTVIMGPNGAGKSLLLRLFHGLIQPTQGEVRAGGQPLGPATRRRQAMVFQRPVLLRRSVAANVRFGLRRAGLPRAARRDRLDALLAEGDLSGKAGQLATTLSGGEQQRLAVMRALATAPDILFLDEPTSSLDPAATQAIEDLLRRASAQGTKIVLVTHDPGQVRRLAEDVVFLHRGQMAEQSPVDRFLSDARSAAARDFLSGDLLV